MVFTKYACEHNAMVSLCSISSSGDYMPNVSIGPSSGCAPLQVAFRYCAHRGENRHRGEQGWDVRAV